MGIITPSSPQEEEQKILQSVKSALPKTNPWLPSSLIKSVPKGLANRTYDYYYILKNAIKQSFPYEAVDEFLQFWADLKNMTPYLSSRSIGPVTWTGVLGSVITAGTTWKVGVVEYTADSTETIEEKTVSVVSLTADGLTGVCVTSDDHNLHSGMSVTVSGANQAEWNMQWDDITITESKRFQFVIPAGMPTPATGTIEITYTAATGSVTSADKGAEFNQTGDTVLTAGTSITGVDDNAGCQFPGLTGGTDDETDEEYSARIVKRWKTPRTPANPATLEDVVKKIAGNTRVWVHRVTPEVGATTVYYVRDGDDDILPDASSEAETKAAVFERFGSNTDENDIYVQGPEGVLINSVVQSVLPATTSMRAAVTATIRSFFRGAMDEGEDLTLDKYKAAIQATYDTVRGEKLQSYILDSPNVDTAVATGQIVKEGSTQVY